MKTSLRTERTRGVFILNTESDFRRRSAPKAFRTNNLWLRMNGQNRPVAIGAEHMCHRSVRKIAVASIESIAPTKILTTEQHPICWIDDCGFWSVHGRPVRSAKPGEMSKRGKIADPYRGSVRIPFQIATLRPPNSSSYTDLFGRDGGEDEPLRDFTHNRTNTHIPQSSAGANEQRRRKSPKRTQ